METTLFTVGEAMLVFSPSTEIVSNSRCQTSQPPRDEVEQHFTRSIGGDELNVAVAFARLSRKALWVSAVPSGPLGDVVVNGAAATGVDTRLIERPGNGAEVGILTVLPQQSTVYYQRRNSAIAKHDPAIFDWDKIFANTDESNAWLHVTGITPLISPSCLETWRRALTTALSKNIRVSLDFNHRKQLDTLEVLWKIISPFIHRFYLAIFSTTSIRELALLHGICAPSPATPLEDGIWVQTMVALRDLWKLPRIACCFKTRDREGLQTRWSVMIDTNGTHTTHDVPVFHRPHCELGGGSAWACGFIDAVTQNVGTPLATLRRADILSALCQETIGDWSDATREDLTRVEEASVGRSIAIPLRTRAAKTQELIERAGVACILRGSNPRACIARCRELVELGAKCLEITLDTVDWLECLRAVRKELPDDVVIGVGTVMDNTVHLLQDASEAGAQFALSPINPRGFIAECSRLDLICVPSASTSSEIWDVHQQGASMVKLFPASLLTVQGFKLIRGVGPFGSILYMPSGGIQPSDVETWWNAGASCVGLGGGLCGSEISTADGSPEHEAAAQKWKDSGREAARALFAKCAERAKKREEKSAHH